jgi:hypothetical protein
MKIETLILPPAFAVKFRRTIEFVISSARPNDWAEMLLASRLVESMLHRASPELSAALARQRLPRGSDALLIRNLPVDDTAEKTPVADVLSLALAGSLGVPFNYSPTPDNNRLVARLEPRPEMRNVKNTGQSNEEFAPHTDWSAIAPVLSPARLILLGVMNDARTWTGLTPIEPLVTRLSPNAVSVLHEPRFVMQVPQNASTRLQLLSKPRPILWDEGTGIQVALPTYWVQPANGPSDTVAQAALDAIIALVNDPSATVKFIIEKGEALIFRNHRVLHSRGKVDDKRLLLRTYSADVDAVELRRYLQTGNLLDVRDSL